MLLSLTLLLPTAGAAPLDDTFHPGTGNARVSLEDLRQGGLAQGRTGRVLVGIDPGGEALLRARPDVRDVRRLGSGAFSVAPLPGSDDLALARDLHGAPGVRWAHPDLLVRLVPAQAPTDPWVEAQWHLENTGQGGRTPDVDIDATTAWAFASGAGQRVAIVDSGVQLDHPDLRVIAGRDYIGRDDNPTPDPGDSSGGPHGTNAAGVVAAIGGDSRAGAGVAYDAEIYAIRLIGGSSSLEAVQEAFVEAVDAGASVISNSWGWGSGCETVPDYGIFDETFTYAERFGREGLGSVIVFAAGNGNCDIANDGMLAQPNVIAVAAVEGNDRRAGYSSFGVHVDIAAPTGLLTTDTFPGGYGSYGGEDAWFEGFSGTSAAAPVVSGTVALMLEANPRLRARDVREVLCDTAVRIDAAAAGYDSAGSSPYYGCGRVDAGAAVAAVANAAPGVPEPLLGDATLRPDGGRLRWAPAEDPDGEPLRYEVAWALGEAEPRRERVEGLELDLREALAPGDVLRWSVRAEDAWGYGPWSDTVTWTVEEPPAAAPAPEPSSCAHAGAGTFGSALLALFLGAARRRRG
jgi:subtilisin family serine protease